MSNPNYHARWTPSDDQYLLALVATNNYFTGKAGKISWEDVASTMNENIKGKQRSATQCRTRWNYKLNPKRKRARNESEDDSSLDDGSEHSSLYGSEKSSRRDPPFESNCSEHHESSFEPTLFTALPEYMDNCFEIQHSDYAEVDTEIHPNIFDPEKLSDFYLFQQYFQN